LPAAKINLATLTLTVAVVDQVVAVEIPQQARAQEAQEHQVKDSLAVPALAVLIGPQVAEAEPAA
jgi:hypothetical protein